MVDATAAVNKITMSTGYCPVALRIDFSHLSIPIEFDPSQPEILERLSQHIFIRASDLSSICSSPFSYSHLGTPLYPYDQCHDERTEFLLHQCDLTDEEMESYLDEIKNILCDHITDYLVDEAIPVGLSAPVENIYRELKEQADQFKANV